MALFATTTRARLDKLGDESRGIKVSRRFSRSDYGTSGVVRASSVRMVEMVASYSLFCHAHPLW